MKKERVLPVSYKLTIDKPNNFTISALENPKVTPTPLTTYEYLITVIAKNNSPDKSFVADVGKKVSIMEIDNGVNIIY